MRTTLLAITAILTVGGTLWLADESPTVTLKNRQELFSSRRLARADHTTLAIKNEYFKRAIHETTATGQTPDLGNVALRMSQIENDYRLNYAWGGSIKNHMKGLDCTGFVHGAMYYLGIPHYHKRFNTRSLYYQLKKDRDWVRLHDSPAGTGTPLDYLALQPGDLILWPSDLSDGKNLPGPIWGHIGIVTRAHGQLHVTHYVSSDAYNNRDDIGLPGPGINTLPVQEFVKLKQRGILSVFRRRESVNGTVPSSLPAA